MMDNQEPHNFKQRLKEDAKRVCKNKITQVGMIYVVFLQTLVFFALILPFGASFLWVLFFAYAVDCLCFGVGLVLVSWVFWVIDRKSAKEKACWNQGK